MGFNKNHCPNADNTELANLTHKQRLRTQTFGIRKHPFNGEKSTTQII